MPDQTNGSKPPRMHGITHVDIPAQYRPSETRPPSRRPISISIVAVYMLIKAVVSLLLALVPWGDPDSGIASFLVANPSLAFSMLPRMFRPIPGMPAAMQSNYVQGLPFIFLFVGVLCGRWPLSCGRCQTSGAGQPFSGHRIRWSARYVFWCSIRLSGVKWLSTSLPCRMNTSWLFLSALPGIC